MRNVQVRFMTVALFGLGAGAVGCAGSKPLVAQPTPVAQAAPPPAPVEAPPPAPAEARPDLAAIHFDFDKSEIRSDDQARLAGIGEYLGAHDDRQITIAGYCDERGTVEYNIALGDRRAASARDYLLRLGVDGTRIRTISYGSSNPVDPGHDETAWSQNRRDEFQLKLKERAAADTK